MNDIWIEKMNNELIQQLKNSTGVFLCQAIGAEKKTKTEPFSHIVTPPKPSADLPDIAEIRAFYDAVGSLRLYHCEVGNEAGFYIANPDKWAELTEGFAEWVEIIELDFDEDELEEEMPSWFGSQQVIGEIPNTGNYLLLVTVGNEKGSIYEFDHDGAEFYKRGVDIEDFIKKMLNPNSALLRSMASHMRFTADFVGQQWWATALRFDDGREVINE